MSRPRPIRTEFDQGEVTISVVKANRGHWHNLSTATPEWRDFEYVETMKEDCEIQVALIGGQGYKTMYDDVCIEGHPEFDGSFENGAKGWTWSKQEKPSSKGEKGTPHGIVETDEAASGRFVAMANNKNHVASAPIKMKKGVITGATDPAKPNLSAMKLTYTPKTGAFSGSFKAYADLGGKLKTHTVKVKGFVVNGVGRGEARLTTASAPWTVTVR